MGTEQEWDCRFPFQTAFLLCEDTSFTAEFTEPEGAREEQNVLRQTLESEAPGETGIAELL